MNNAEKLKQERNVRFRKITTFYIEYYTFFILFSLTFITGMYTTIMSIYYHIPWMIIVSIATTIMNMLLNALMIVNAYVRYKGKFSL